MKKLFAPLACLLFCSMAGAQKETAVAKASNWTHGGSVAIVGGQGGTRNSAQGIEKFSLSGVAAVQLWAVQKTKNSSWKNTANLSYGLINTSSHGIRKMDDKIDLYSLWSYQLTQKVGVGVAANLRTQFSNGYDFSEETRKRISGFFAPAYVVFSPGVQYQPFSFLSMHLGPMARWIIVTNAPYSFNYQGGITPDGYTERTLASLYGVNPARKLRIEYGLYFSALFEKEVMKNIFVKSRLDVSSDAAKRADGNRYPGNADVYSTTSIAMQVNKWIQVLYQFDVVYDDDVKIFGWNKNVAAAQLKSVLGVGVAARF